MKTRSVALAAMLFASTAFAQAQDTITIVLPEQPENLEPCGTILTHIGQVMNQNLVEALTEINPDTGEPEPKLAESWERIDDTTWHFKLRDGVTFHDGEAFNAEAAIFSIERMTSGDLTCNNVAKFGGLALQLSAIDDLALEIKTEEPQPILPTLLSVANMVSPNTPPDEAVNDPVGTGPYKLDSFDQQSVVVSRYDDYWGEQPEVAGATYVWRSESSIRAAMVETGEADLTPSIALQDATNPDMDFAYLNSETTDVRIDTTRPPLDDVRVRKALNLAIDWEGLAGLFGADVVRASQVVVPGINGHDSELAPWPYDPEEAARLIEEAAADGVPVDTEITLIGRNGIYPNGNEAMEAMMVMWQAAGLNVSLQMLDVADWVRYLQKPFPEERGPNLLQRMHDNNKGDAAFSIPVYYHSEGQYSTLSNDALDAEIDAALAAEGTERTKGFKAIFGKVHDEIVADIPMFHMVGYTRVGERLDWKPDITTNSEIPLADIRFKD